MRARVFRVSFGKVHGTSRDYKIRILNIIFFFRLNLNLRTNFGISMTKHISFRLNRLWGIRICNRV